ncbi:Translocon-associated protein beta (TRAPB) [uncultured archaeon]|nr:Translocon-associated protein beta (TRAPB) [uncultured archaeon]
MRLTYMIVLIAIIMTSSQAKDSNNEVTFSDFTLYTGDSVEIASYTIQLVEVQSVRDGIVIIRATKAGGALDEQRALLQNNANSFDGGSDNGGLTVTITDIFDDQSAKVRVEYPRDLGTPRKQTAESGSKGLGNQPVLAVEKSFDNDNPSVGGEVKVTVTVKNIGGSRADDIVVDDQPPLANFVYIAGYPPKIKSQLDPGESDSAIYVINAVKEGTVKVPSIEVRYSDSKKNTKSNESAPFNVVIAPKSKPNLDIKLNPSGSIPLGQKGRLNVSLYNSGKATAYKVEIKSEIEPAGGLDATDLDKSYFEIDPGAMESYSAELTGRSSGEYTVNLKISYQDGNDVILKEGSTTIVVLEREYKYLYYLLILPVLAVSAWLIKRYKEYKY